jgi:ankyrin repeat protein
MKLLLEKGADPDARDMTGRTPLFLASKGASITALKVILLFSFLSYILLDSFAVWSKSSNKV